MTAASVPLKQVGIVTMGTAPPGHTYNEVGEGLPMIAGAGDFGEIYPSPKKWTTHPTRIAEPGELLVCVRATIGDLNWADRDYCLGRGVAAIRARDARLDLRYLARYLHYRRSKLAENATGSTFPAIRRSHLDDFAVPLPSPDDQRRIAAILDKADASRRKRESAIALTEQFAHSAFLKMFGDPVTNPKGWRVGRLDDLCSDVIDCPHSTPRYTEETKEYACVRSSDIQRSYLDWTTTKYVDALEYEERIRRTTPVPGDVIYCREGARFGNVARIVDRKKVCLGQRMMLFRLKPDRATPEFLWAFLASDRTYHQAVTWASGSASPHVNVRDIKAFKTIMPPVELQEKFAQAVHFADAIRERVLTAADESTLLFESLVQRAFRGELTSGAALATNAE